MTSTAKRWIAREWLIFLACIVIALVATYFTLYFGTPVDIGYHKEYTPEEQEFIDNVNRSKTHGGKPDVFEEAAASLAEEKGRVVRDYRYKNPGDMFNDLWPILHTVYSGGRVLNRRNVIPNTPNLVWNGQAANLWLCVLSPYLALWFVRLTLWSVNSEICKRNFKLQFNWKD
jgi:hypothetical protein